MVFQKIVQEFQNFWKCCVIFGPVCQSVKIFFKVLNFCVSCVFGPVVCSHLPLLISVFLVFSVTAPPPDHGHEAWRRLTGAPSRGVNSKATEDRDGSEHHRQQGLEEIADVTVRPQNGKEARHWRRWRGEWWQHPKIVISWKLTLEKCKSDYFHLQMFGLNYSIICCVVILL